MSNIHGKHVHSVKTWRNLMGYCFFGKYCVSYRRFWNNWPLHFSVVEQSNLVRCVPNVVQIVWVGSTFLLFVLICLWALPFPEISSIGFCWKLCGHFVPSCLEKLAIQFLKRTTLEWIKHFFTTGLCKSIKGLINSEPEWWFPCQISVEVSKSCKNCRRSLVNNGIRVYVWIKTSYS